MDNLFWILLATAFTITIGEENSNGVCLTKLDDDCPVQNVKLNGGVVIKTQANIYSWELCAKRCYQNRRCQTWTWTKRGIQYEDLKCTLHESFLFTSYDNTTISGWRSCQSTRKMIDACPKKSYRLHGPIHPVIIEDVATLRECSLKCQDSDKCKYWTWKKDTDKDSPLRCILMEDYDKVVPDSYSSSGMDTCPPDQLQLYGGCPLKGYQLQQGTVLKTISSYNRVTWQECAKQCRELDKCNYWNWCKSCYRKSCWLMQSIIGVYKSRIHISGMKNCDESSITSAADSPSPPIPPAPATIDECPKDNTGINGGKLIKIRTSIFTWENCAKICHLLDKCNAWTWNKDGKEDRFKCWLKEGFYCTYADKSKMSGLKSCRSPRDDNKHAKLMLYCPQRLRNLVGEVNKVEIQNVQQWYMCAQLCKDNKTCKYYNWLKKGEKTCTLMSDFDNDNTFNTSYYSGMDTCPGIITPLDGGSDCPLSNTEIKGGGPKGKVYQVDSWEDCAQKCREKLNCNYWMWDIKGSCSTYQTFDKTIESSNFISGTRNCAKTTVTAAPAPAPGIWSEWSWTSTCNVWCGGGLMSRSRTCSNKNCDGSASENVVCNTEECTATSGYYPPAVDTTTAPPPKPTVTAHCVDGKYDGDVSITKGGFTCQKWTDQYPWTHDYTYVGYQWPDSSLEAAENYCRQPDGATYPAWCYTTDVNKRYDYCDVPPCGEDSDRTYGGNANGADCMFPFQYKGKKNNECITTNSNGVRWCYTDTRNHWGYCDLV